MAISKKNADMNMDMGMKCNCGCCGPGFIVPMIIAAIVLPFLFIWSLNTLFLTSIPFNFFTWFAALIIIIVLSGGRMKKRFWGCGSGCGCGCGGYNWNSDMKK